MWGTGMCPEKMSSVDARRRCRAACVAVRGTVRAAVPRVQLCNLYACVVGACETGVSPASPTPALPAAGRSHSTSVSMSAGRDFELLATASKRSGDDMKAAISLFNLGVTFDNSRQYAKAIEVTWG